MTIKRLVGLASAIVFAWAGFAASSEAAEFNFVHATVNPKKHIDYPVNMDFVERVKRLSKGRIDFRVFVSGVLGDEKEMVEQIKSGTITTARITPAILGSICSGQRILNLPFLFTSGEHMLKAVNSSQFSGLCDDILVKEGIRPVGYWWMGVRDLYSKKPVKSISDVQGLKVRTWQDKYVVKSWKALGAIPTPISFSELYTSMQTGVVDGGEGWAASYNARSFFEVAPYLTKLGYINIASTLVISEKAWRKLPDDLKAAVLKAGAENSQFAFDTFKAHENGIYDLARKNGAKVFDVTDIAKWREITAPVIDQFVKDNGAKEAAFIEWVKKSR